MVASTAGQRAHSAQVEIELLLDVKREVRIVPVAQVGPGFLLTRELVEHAPTEAELVLWVDGREDRRRVLLPDGLGRGGSKTARISKAG
jgi:hypothetical protein